MFYSDTFPQIVWSLSLCKGKMFSGFAIGLPRQRRVHLLVLNELHTKTVLGMLRHVECLLFKV